MSHSAWTTVGMVVMTLWGFSWVAAGEPTTAPERASKPMSITSRSMTVKNLDQRVVFDQDVSVTISDMDLSADRVEVILVKPAASGEGASPFSGGVGPNLLAEDNIDQIVAEGRVKVVQGTKTATADRAVYRRSDETVVLTGHPETWEEGVKIQGSRITILLKEQRSIVEESKVVIYPESPDGGSGELSPPRTDGG